MLTPITVEGLQFRFERRRYGRTTYTWAEVKAPTGEWLNLGDPWPSINPKRTELLQAARERLERPTQ